MSEGRQPLTQTDGQTTLELTGMLRRQLSNLFTITKDDLPMPRLQLHQGRADGPLHPAQPRPHDVPPVLGHSVPGVGWGSVGGDNFAIKLVIEHRLMDGPSLTMPTCNTIVCSQQRGSGSLSVTR